MKVLLKGKCEYAQVLPGQERGPHPDNVKAGKADPTDRHYEITVECSRDVFKKLKKAGLNAMHQLREKDEDDSTWLKLKGTKKKTTAKGSWDFEDVAVIGPNEQPWDPKTNIGNGSIVVVEASLEPAGNSMALRLKGVQVLEHVPYEGKGYDDGEVLDLTGSEPAQVKKETPNVNDMF